MTPTTHFASATSVTPLGDGRWSGHVDEGWDILGNTNGGYLLAIAARAMAAAADRPDPVTVTAHYLAPGRVGPVEVETRLVRSGRRFATVEATLAGAERPLLALVGTFGTATPSALVERPHVDGAPPDLPDPDDCVRLLPGDPVPPRFMEQVDLRLHPDDVVFGSGDPNGVPRLRGWFRLRDDEPITTIALLNAVDSFPPTTFNLPLPMGWTPTVELTAHIRAIPEPGWLSCLFSTRFVTGGFLEVDGEVWDGSGTLVAQSRQLALLPRG